MPSVEQAFAWLLSLPVGALYATALAAAFVENIFPPAPSDLFIGLCAFVAAAGGTPTIAVFGCVMAGTLSGAAMMYGLGRRYGAAGMRARMEARGWVRRGERVEQAYQRYGLIALFVGRMIPGVRAIVPMVAGAMRLSPLLALIVVTAASAIWYGLIVWLASRVGGNWESYAGQLAVFTRWGTGVGVGLALVGTLVAVLALRGRRAK